MDHGRLFVNRQDDEGKVIVYRNIHSITRVSGIFRGQSAYIGWLIGGTFNSGSSNQRIQPCWNRP